VPIEHSWVTKSIARAQKQVEAQNFSVRKHLLEYDDVMNKQRENVYGLRRQLLEGQIRFEDDPDPVGIRDYLMTIGEGVMDSVLDTDCDESVDPEEWDLGKLKEDASQIFGLEPQELAALDEGGHTRAEIREILWNAIVLRYTSKEEFVGRELLAVPEDVQRQLIPPEKIEEVHEATEDERLPVAGRAVIEPIARSIMLQIVDAQWKDHLYSLDHLKEGIGLRGYGQRDPLVEYKKESFALFQAMKDRIDEEMLRYLWRLRPIISQGPDESAGSPAPAPPRRPPPSPIAPRPTSQRQMQFNDPKQAPSPAFAGVGRSSSSGAAASATASAPRPARVGGDDAPVRTVRREEPKVGRNDPCPCGSGKKYKKCHGAGAGA
jgi:preprotein translocase subunit SecA